MPDQFYLQLTLRYLHILGAISLMGGTIFMRFALLPTVSELDAEIRRKVHEGVRSQWAKFVAGAALLLLVSGIANLGLAARYEITVPGGLSYNLLGGLKLILALPIFLFASFLTGRSAAAQKFQANPGLWMNVNLVLALVLVLIGGWLRFSDKQLKEKYRTPATAQVQVQQ